MDAATSTPTDPPQWRTYAFTISASGIQGLPKPCTETRGDGDKEHPHTAGLLYYIASRSKAIQDHDRRQIWTDTMTSGVFPLLQYLQSSREECSWLGAALQLLVLCENPKLTLLFLDRPFDDAIETPVAAKQLILQLEPSTSESKHSYQRLWVAECGLGAKFRTVMDNGAESSMEGMADENNIIAPATSSSD